MLERYFRRFSRDRAAGTTLTEENMERVAALSSELLVPGKSVVVMGCGVAGMGRVLVRLRHHVTALESVAGEHQTLKNAGVIHDSKGLTGNRMVLEDECCDVLVSGFSFLTGVSRPLFLREMARVLRPGGQIILIESEARNASGIKRVQKRLQLSTPNVEPITAETIRHYGGELFTWKPPYRFSFLGGSLVMLGERSWDDVPVS